MKFDVIVTGSIFLQSSIDRDMYCFANQAKMTMDCPTDCTFYISKQVDKIRVNWRTIAKQFMV